MNAEGHELDQHEIDRPGETRLSICVCGLPFDLQIDLLFMSSAASAYLVAVALQRTVLQ